MSDTKPPRAIKFRAWDKEEKVMIDADSWYFSEEFEPFIDSVEKCIRRFELMQYTGLPDKKGTEIYEGDVLEYETTKRKFYIYWSKKELAWCAGFCGEKQPPDGINRLSRYELDRAEVIGNIYQNPDLLTADV